MAPLNIPISNPNASSLRSDTVNACASQAAPRQAATCWVCCDKSETMHLALWKQALWNACYCSIQRLLLNRLPITNSHTILDKTQNFIFLSVGLVFVLIAERRLRVSWNRALRKILGPNGGEVRGGLWRLHTEENRELWTSHNFYYGLKFDEVGIQRWRGDWDC